MQEGNRKSELGFGKPTFVGISALADSERSLEYRDRVARSPHFRQGVPNARKGVGNARVIDSVLSLEYLSGTIIRSLCFREATELHENLSAIVELVTDTRMKVSER